MHRYALLRAKRGAGHEPIAPIEMPAEGDAAEADPLAAEIDDTRLQIAALRAAAADVLAAQTALRLATARLEAALRDHREASAADGS